MNSITLRDGFRRLTVAQGETKVSDREDVVLTTVLGSCVAACFYDPVAKVGGLNHYLLAEGNVSDPASMQRYGVYAMEVLINAMLSMGAVRSRMKARIFGGATMRSGFRDIGGDNIAFARRFLRDEKIPLVGEDVGGNGARRVEFRAALGLARCRVVTEGAPPPLLRVAPAPVSAIAHVGDVEFF
ncbi:chemotaxis protein CheD [Sphingomonas citri]|jgi:chemotaxis protein CheD|uniref:Probable chemoreceptor glutamine deamidase CheD n=1 Tax=Sphingomonas citri TaxID=2862499 RepID=A0ABS7BQV9_9SPHN|nr:MULTISPECIES: chemotaxis protein CheD [Sphingomonas]MBB3345837.1 chemotaxis protein CheD [Sphingomonas sp. BK069]MBB3474568.1 chemotaxis protein CheD [Sphingomonas sp. BK345]MBW6531991.1 chemotaxis protein CheD [Sphingomonas citri]